MSRHWPALVGSALVLLFAALGYVAHHAGAGTAVDHCVLHAMVDSRQSWLTPIAIFVTNLGGPEGMWVLGIIAGVGLWWRTKRVSPLLTILAALATTELLMSVTKGIFGTHRPAPALRLVHETSPSYPSGHTLTALAILGLLAYILGRGRARSAQIWLAVAAGAGTVVVAVSRLYLGVHWLSDVTGGALLGGAVLTAAIWLYDRCSPAAPTD